MSKQTIALVVALLAATALSAAATASTGSTKPKAGHYTGTTSEHAILSLSVSKEAKKITGFSTTDGYNSVCQFSGGVGGIPTYTVKVPSMKLTKNGAFSGTAKVKVGPFSGTFRVSGKVTGGAAKGTVNEVGSRCGSGATNPTAADYLETFSAKRK